MQDLTLTEKEVLSVLEDRWKIGRERYGEGISYKQQKTDIGWADNAIEEAADMLQYLVALKLFLLNKKHASEIVSVSHTKPKMESVINFLPEDEFGAGWDREGGYYIRQDKLQVEKALHFMEKTNAKFIYFGLVDNPVKYFSGDGRPDVVLLLSATQRRG
jgi:hypothetical protein